MFYLCVVDVTDAEIALSAQVANPGCYPTSVQLPLVPLLQSGLITTEDIIIDAKSGVSGAGKGTASHCVPGPRHLENRSEYTISKG